MNTKTMEGLVGARTNMELTNTPMRVYKEARRRGDTGAMKRAMGYVNDFEDRAQEYKEKTDEGMKEDAKAAREEAKAEREKAIERRREEREEIEKRLEEDRMEGAGADTVEISEEGKALLKRHVEAQEQTGSEISKAELAKESTAKESVTYTKTGDTIYTGQDAGNSVAVSV